MSAELLTIEDLVVSHSTASGCYPVVDGISFSIQQGETFALLGESGCGKSMTALAILQLLSAEFTIDRSSSVRLFDQELLALTESRLRNIRGRRIAMIFQEPMTSLNPVLTIGEQIHEVLTLHANSSYTHAERRSQELLDSVGIPDPARCSSSYPHQLSGGMKQRVMIAMALAGEPDLLIADEPTTALDVTIQAQVLSLLRDIQRRTRMAILLITHDMSVVANVADRLAVMYAGQIVEQASTEDFFKQQYHPYSKQLLYSLPSLAKRGNKLAAIPGRVPDLRQTFSGCPFAERCQSVWSDCHSMVPNWLPFSRQRGVRCHLYDSVSLNQAEHQQKYTNFRTSIQQQAITSKFDLVVSNLKVYYPVRKGLFRKTVGYVKAVDNLSFTIPTGKVFALVGESGCGKTSVGRAIVQLIKPIAGSIQFAGNDLCQLTQRQLRAARQDIQYIFQDPFSAMNPRMLVGQIIEEGMIAQNLYSTKERSKQVRRYIDMVGLPRDSASRYPHEFSGGQRQRICLARSLAVKPKLLICDEPTSALDVSVQAQILNLMKELQLELGFSYLFITHNISAVAYLADVVAVMYLGRIVEQGPVQAMLDSPQHPYTKLLLSSVLEVYGQRYDFDLDEIKGEQPSPLNPPQGCHFHPRCGVKLAACKLQYPPTVIQQHNHSVACLHYKDTAPADASHIEVD